MISAAMFAGVWISGQGTDGNAVAGNFIGTDLTGDVALDNGTSPVYVLLSERHPIGGGVVIDGGASDNRIGTDGRSVDDAGQRNVIAGSDNDGIDIIGTGTDGNIVAGNFIGTDLTGTLALGIARRRCLHHGRRVRQLDRGQPQWRRGRGDEGNLISGNRYSDRRPDLLTVKRQCVAGDKIGTDVTGAVALGNVLDGVMIDNRARATRSAGRRGEADIISGNGAARGVGIALDSSSITWWRVTSSAPTRPGRRPWAMHRRVWRSIIIGTSTDNTIGGTSAIAGNLITDNGGPGVAVSGSSDSSVGNQITANRIFGNTGQAIDLGDDGVTDNGTAPREGPNNLQNFPIIFTAAGGQTEGWLGGSEPDTTYRIDFFASAGLGPGGAGRPRITWGRSR